MRVEVVSFMAGLTILITGGVMLLVYGLRSRSRERDFLWIGLFALLYGSDLVLRNPVFQLGFKGPNELSEFLPRMLNACSIVPALLLFREYYGSGWRSSLTWLTVAYSVAAASVYGYMIFYHLPEMMPSAGASLIVLIPVVLSVGYLRGYQRPQIARGRLLFAGLLCFFLAFSMDHLRNAETGRWRAGLEPYGFVVLLGCLSVVATQRVLEDERRLRSMTEEMRAATAIQTAILPRTVPSSAAVRIAARYAPMTAVAGDFYDFPTISPDCIALVIIDVMGHGVPAALIASMVKVAVLVQPRQEGHTAATIEALNTLLYKQAPGQYVTGVYLHFNTATKQGTYSAAGHPPPLLWSRTRQRLTKLEGGGLLLGMRPHEPYPELPFSMSGGDRLLLYTDGVTEAENAAGVSFGDEALPAFLEEHGAESTDVFADALQHAVLAWAQSGAAHGQADDITFMVMDCLNDDPAGTPAS